MRIKEVIARTILDSRNQKTIEVEVITSAGKKSLSSSPSGKSRGKFEAQPFSQKGIDFSVSFLNVLGKKIRELKFETFEDLEQIEELARKFDDTKNLSKIGGNALYALESAILKAISLSNEQELWQFLCSEFKTRPSLPLPLGNCIGGGMHSPQTKKPDFQEFLLLPGTKTFFDAYFINLQAYNIAKQILLKKDNFWQKKLTDENSLASTLDNESVLQILQQTIEKVREKFNVKIDLGIDAAAGTFYDEKSKTYNYRNLSSFPENKSLSRSEQIQYINKISKDYSLSYIEDPLNEEDFEGFSQLNKRCKNICGDDLIATSPERIEEAAKQKAISYVIIKPNQAGSLIKTKQALDAAKKHGIVPIISHRSGETLDNTISHLAVAWNIPIIKTGILGKERFAKLNELLRIERNLKS